MTSENNQQKFSMFESLSRRPHSYREHSVSDWRIAWCEALGDPAAEARVRGLFRSVESGRFHDMLEAVHKMACALDDDELAAFCQKNYDMMLWVDVYASIEELRHFDF